MKIPKSLSPAAQAVRRDLSQIMHELSQRCRVSISATDTLPITLETNDASLQAGINSLCGSALRAAAAQLTFEDSLAGAVISPRELLDIAAELEGVQ